MPKTKKSLTEVMIIKIYADNDGKLSASGDVKSIISKQAVIKILNAVIEEIEKDLTKNLN